MSGRALRVTSRIAFILCGLISLLTGALYALLQGEDLPYQSEWVVFVVALGVVGLFSVVVALLPRSWIAKACRKDRDDPSLFSAPLKLLEALAAISYLVAVGSHFAPHRWHLNLQLMLLLCPMYIVRMSVDPSPTVIFLLLAPMNAGVYGSVGVILAYGRMVFRGR